MRLVDVPPTISPSSSSTLIECERKWWWRYKHGLGKDERTEALAMGGGLAMALETGDVFGGLLEYENRRPLVDAFTDPVVREREGWIAHATITQAFNGYLKRWPDIDVTREETYLVGLSGTGRILQVRVDGVAPTHLIEDKLRSGSSMRDADIENEIRQGIQLTAEIYAHWRATGELLPVHLRCIKKIDPRKVKNRTLQADVDAEMEAHFEKEGVFCEWQATRTLDQLLEFEAEMVGMARRMNELALEHKPAGRRNTKACHAYGRTCAAISVCQGMTDPGELMT